MTTTNPLDRIEVGKQYRLDIRFAELLPCPSCGHCLGQTEKDLQDIDRYNNTTVVAIGAAPQGRCHMCDYGLTGLEGYYVVRAIEGETWAVPYPWLQPLEPSGPEPRGG